MLSFAHFCIKFFIVVILFPTSCIIYVILKDLKWHFPFKFHISFIHETKLKSYFNINDWQILTQWNTANGDLLKTSFSFYLKKEYFEKRNFIQLNFLRSTLKPFAFDTSENGMKNNLIIMSASICMSLYSVGFIKVGTYFFIWRSAILFLSLQYW